MPLFKEKTLFHDPKEGLTLWIKLINQELGVFELYLLDRDFQASYRVAEFDGKRYNVLNQRVFGGIYYKIVKENPSVLDEIKSFMYSYKPESNSFSAMCARLSERFDNWKEKKKRGIQGLWKPKKNTN